MWIPTKTLLVMAHPDDEIIFGWPVFQGNPAGLLICSSDLHNPDRQWCRHRKHVTAALCGERGISFKCLDYPSEFYRLETRGGALAGFCSDVAREIVGFDHNVVYTHNPLGEYGHLDHVLVNQVVVMSSQKPVLWSNMFVASNWVPWKSPSCVAADMMFRNRLAECHLDEGLYARCEAKYREAGVWTWSKPPIKTCEVFTNG